MKRLNLALALVMVTAFLLAGAVEAREPDDFEDVRTVGIVLANLGDIVTSSTTATGSITVTSQPSAAETVTISDTNSSYLPLVMEFYANGGSYTGSDTGVEIGSNIQGTADNLAAAINADTLWGARVDASPSLHGHDPKDVALYGIGNAAFNGGNVVGLAEAATGISVSGAAMTGGTIVTPARFGAYQTCFGKLVADGGGVLRQFTWTGSVWKYTDALN